MCGGGEIPDALSVGTMWSSLFVFMEEDTRDGAVKRQGEEDISIIISISPLKAVSFMTFGIGALPV